MLNSYSPFADPRRFQVWDPESEGESRELYLHPLYPFAIGVAMIVNLVPALID